LRSLRWTLEKSSSTNSVFESFNSFFGHFTFLHVFFGFEVIISLFGVVSDSIVWILITSITFESVLIGLGNFVHSDWLVENWASLDTSDLSRRISVFGVFKKIVLGVAHQAGVLIFTFEATF